MECDLHGKRCVWTIISGQGDYSGLAWRAKSNWSDTDGADQ